MSTKKNNTALSNLFEKIHPLTKLAICLGAALLVYFLVVIKHLDVITHILMSWEAFTICLITMDWITFSVTKTDQIREQARIQDPSRATIFLIILISTLASFLAILLLVVTKNFKNQQSIHLIVAVAGLILSWLLIHSIFTLRYAHIYYDDDENDPEKHAAGLNFPDDDKPDYKDFAYFSFVIGMTFQVSDVEIESKKIRRIVLWHGMLSFFYNTIMIALTINMIAGFGN